MPHIYLCLVNAPMKFYEREGVLRFAGEVREGKSFTAWEQLIELLEVADGTAHKALRWMAEQKLIGYYAGKNGVGIRIFLNRAAASVKHETEHRQKNLRLLPAANRAARVSRNETPFKIKTREILDQEIDSHAPKNGAESDVIDKFSSAATPETASPSAEHTQPATHSETNEVNLSADTIDLESLVERIKRELESCVKSVATSAATQAAAREHERTRDWLDKYGLPKAARVAQREAYQIFKHQAGKVSASQRAHAELQVGRNADMHSPSEPKPRTPAEIAEVAEMCLTMLDVQGKPVEQTLAEMCANDGWLLPSDVPKVRDAIVAMLRAR